MATSLGGQVELNGLLMGPSTAYEIIHIDGLGILSPRSNDVPRTTGDGSYPGADLLPDRTVTVTMDVVGTEGADIAAKLRALATAWNRSSTVVALEYRLWTAEPARWVDGKPRGVTWSIDIVAQSGLVQAVVAEFVCTDPNIYDDPEHGSVVLV